MSEMLRIRKSTLDAIGDAIREKSGSTDLISPLNMPAEILALSTSNGGSINPANITVYTGSDYPVSPKENDVFINTSTYTAYMYVNGVWTEILYTSLIVTLFNTETTVSTGSAKASNIGISVDLTNYKKLYITSKTTGTDGKHNWWVGVFSANYTGTAYATLNSAFVKGITNNPSGSLSKTIIEIDVSDLSGSYFVGLGVHSATNYSATGTLYEIKAE